MPRDTLLDVPGLLESGASLTLSGQTGADAGIYQEKDVKEAIRKAKGQ